MSLPTAVTKTVLSADGTEIHAEAFGDPSLPAIVFVHGMNMSAASLYSIPSDPKWLAHAYIVMYDMRGHGRSGKPTEAEDYASKRQAEDFFAVIEAYGVKKPFFAGWSMGALRGYICIGGLPWLGAVLYKICPPEQQSNFPGMCSTDDVALYTKSVEHFIDALVAPTFALPYTLRTSWIGMAMAVQPNVRILMLLREQDPSAYVKDGPAGLPIMMLHGTADLQVIGTEVQKILEGLFGERLRVRMLDGVGHAPFVEAPDEFQDAILEFVSEVDSEPGTIST